MANKTKLKQCPCCGGDAEFDRDGHGWHWIQCRKCGMCTNQRASTMEDCRPLLAEAWNMRTADVAHPADAALTDTTRTNMIDCFNGDAPMPTAVPAAPLSTVEARYRDLLTRLGCNGHDGAIAEIGLLRRHLDITHGVGCPHASKDYDHPCACGIESAQAEAKVPDDVLPSAVELLTRVERHPENMLGDTLLRSNVRTFLEKIAAQSAQEGKV